MATAPPASMMTNDQMKQLVAKVAAEKGVDPGVLMGLIQKESMGTNPEDPRGFNPQAMGDNNNAFGVGQLHRGAMKDVGMTGNDWMDPEKNVAGAADYFNLQKKRFGGDEAALMAYNGGPGNMARGTVSPEAQKYASQVLVGGTQGAAPPFDPEAAVAASTAGLPPLGGPPLDQLPGPVGGGGRVEAGSQEEMTPPPEELQTRTLFSGSGVPAPGPEFPGAAAPPTTPFSANFSRPNGIIPMDSKEGGGGFGGVLRKIGHGLKTALPYIIGGPAYAMANLMGPLQDSRDKRTKDMETWKAEREQKTKWENAQVDEASKLMESLQGLDLRNLINQASDPTQKALLTQAAQKVQEIGQKYAKAVSGESPGGAAITPKEAGELLQMKAMFQDQFAAISTAKGDADAVAKGRQEGLTAGASSSELQRRAAAGDEIARAQVNRAKGAGAMVEMEVGGGKKIPMSVGDAAQWQNSQTARVRNEMLTNPGSVAYQRWAIASAPLMNMLAIQIAEAGQSGNRQEMMNLMGQLEELKKNGAELAKFAGGKTTPFSVPQGVTREDY